MTNENEKMPELEEETRQILDELLNMDETITVRAVSRRHSTIKHASTFTRNAVRSELITKYQVLQKERRSWTKKAERGREGRPVTLLADRDLQILEYRKQIEVLTASHIAMIRIVGELGGMAKWMKLFEGYSEILKTLFKLGAIPKGHSDSSGVPLLTQKKRKPGVPTKK